MTATESLDENSIIMQDIMQVLRTEPYNIDEKDIQTSGFGVYAEYDYQGPTGDQVLAGYRVNNNVRVVVRNVEQLGDLLDAIVQAGANSIGGIDFGIDDPSLLVTQARQQAVQDAAARATLYAETAGVKLGPILSMTEPGATTHFEGGYGYSAPGYSAQPPIASGEEGVTASISVVYALYNDD